MQTQAEFGGIRARMYEIAIAGFPNAREQDIEAMHRLLAPRPQERILGIGEGNGYFCRQIANAVGTKGEYLVADPSQDQLNNLKRRTRDLPQVETFKARAEELNLPESYFDKVWSFGAFHHIPNQTYAMKNINRALKPNGRAVICDVFQGTSLARHFDTKVARYCVTGHEVKFLSEEFARSLCYLAGFNEDGVRIEDLPLKWKFKSEEDIGEFIYNLHALAVFQCDKQEAIRKTVQGCKDLLGVSNSGGVLELNWPMKALIATK